MFKFVCDKSRHHRIFSILATCQLKWLSSLSLCHFFYGQIQGWLIISGRRFSFHLSICFLFFFYPKYFPPFIFLKFHVFYFIFRKQIHAHSVMAVPLLTFLTFVTIKKKKIMTVGKCELIAVRFICYAENIKVRKVSRYELWTVLKYTEIYYASY